MMLDIKGQIYLRGAGYYTNTEIDLPDAQHVMMLKYLTQTDDRPQQGFTVYENSDCSGVSKWFWFEWGENQLTRADLEDRYFDMPFFGSVELPIGTALTVYDRNIFTNAIQTLKNENIKDNGQQTCY